MSKKIKPIETIEDRFANAKKNNCNSFDNADMFLGLDIGSKVFFVNNRREVKEAEVSSFIAQKDRAGYEFKIGMIFDSDGYRSHTNIHIDSSVIIHKEGKGLVFFFYKDEAKRYLVDLILADES